MGGVSSTIFSGIAAAPGLLALSLFWGQKDQPIPQPLVSCEAPVHCECVQPASAASFAGFLVGTVITFVLLRAFNSKKAPASLRLPAKPRGRLSLE